jgi:tetratricopeptide (TPR) repeat protein
MLEHLCINENGREGLRFPGVAGSRATSMKHRGRKLTSALLVGLVYLLADSAIVWGATSTLNKIRARVHDSPAFTRLVFEIQGDRPSRLVPGADNFEIDFQQLRTKLQPNYPVRYRSSTISSVGLSAGDTTPKIIVKYRHKDQVATSMFLAAEPPRPDHYRLVVDVFRKTDAKAAENSGEKTAGEPAPAVKTAEVPKGSGTDGNEPAAPPQIQPPAPAPAPQVELPEPLRMAADKMASGDYKDAHALYAQFMAQGSPKPNEMSAGRYGLADSYYSLHKNDLKDTASQVLDHYLKALKTDPASPDAPWAILRCSEAYDALGNSKQSTENLELLVRKYPSHPAASLGWISLGKIYRDKKSYVDAIQAFRTALAGTLDKTDRAEADWLLGECLYIAGKHSEATEVLERCMNEAPEFYLSHPLILRYLAESFFVTRHFNKSRDYLFWYLNIEPESGDRDLVLARIAEIMTEADNPQLANKLHDYIQVHYPDSEGYVITMIRKAEYMEQRDKRNQGDAEAIYRELCQKQLSEPLSRLVRFKYALWQYDHGKFEESLKILDNVLTSSSSKTPKDDFLALRRKVILGWAKSSYEKKDYARVIRLYEANKRIFAEASSSDLDGMVADSYGKLGVYANSVGLYQQLVQKESGPKKDELLLKIANYTFLGGEPDKALQIAGQVTPGAAQPEKTLLLGRIYFAQKNYPTVVQLFNGLLNKSQPPPKLDVECSDAYGESLMNVGHYEKALPWLQQTLDQLKKQNAQPADLVRLYTLESACYKNLKNDDKAIQSLEEALSVANSDYTRDQLNYQISNLYLDMGQKDKATQKLNQLLTSTQGFWQTAAKQQLGYIQLQKN